SFGNVANNTFSWTEFESDLAGPASAKLILESRNLYLTVAIDKVLIFNYCDSTALVTSIKVEHGRIIPSRGAIEFIVSWLVLNKSCWDGLDHRSVRFVCDCDRI
ncbi:hypothetical protein C465_01609, partial [Halorubrum distributum JCM 9100]